MVEIASKKMPANASLIMKAKPATDIPSKRDASKVRKAWSKMSQDRPLFQSTDTVETGLAEGKSEADSGRFISPEPEVPFEVSAKTANELRVAEKSLKVGRALGTGPLSQNDARAHLASLMKL